MQAVNKEHLCDHVPSSYRTVAPGPLVSSRLLHRLTASLGSIATPERGRRTPTSEVPPSTQPATVQPLHQTQEFPLPRGPRHQPIDQSTTAPNKLARHLEDRRAKGRELHP